METETEIKFRQLQITDRFRFKKSKTEWVVMDIFCKGGPGESIVIWSDKQSREVSTDSFFSPFHSKRLPEQFGETKVILTV